MIWSEAGLPLDAPTLCHDVTFLSFNPAQVSILAFVELSRHSERSPGLLRLSILFGRDLTAQDKAMFAPSIL